MAGCVGNEQRSNCLTREACRPRSSINRENVKCLGTITVLANWNDGKRDGIRVAVYLIVCPQARACGSDMVCLFRWVGWRYDAFIADAVEGVGKMR